jgi:CrcB protein
LIEPEPLRAVGRQVYQRLKRGKALPAPWHGLIVAVLEAHSALSPNWRYLVPIGFIGAYTTFSTFEFETFRIVQDGDLLVASLNIVLSVVVGFVAVWWGIAAGRALS